MFYINVWLTVNDPKDVSRVRELLTRCKAEARGEDGFERFAIYHSETDPRHFLLNEHWRSQADWEAHRTRKAYKEIYAPQVLPLVTREPHISSLVE